MSQQKTGSKAIALSEIETIYPQVNRHRTDRQEPCHPLGISSVLPAAKIALLPLALVNPVLPLAISLAESPKGSPQEEGKGHRM